MIAEQMNRMWIRGWVLLLLLVSACGGKESDREGETTASEVVLTVEMDLDSTTITRFCKEGTPAILAFGGKRCISCAKMRENFAKLRERYPELRIGYVYWEDSPRLFDAWDIGLIPAQVVLDSSGTEITRHTGVWAVEEMDRTIRELYSIAN